MALLCVINETAQLKARLASIRNHPHLSGNPQSELPAIKELSSTVEFLTETLSPIHYKPKAECRLWPSLH